LDLKADISLKDLKFDPAKLPSWARILIVVVVPVLLAVAYYFTQFEPKKKTIDRLTADIQKQVNEISVKETKARRLAVLKDENQWLEARLRELQEQLPDEKEVSGLLRQISDLGHAAGLEINSWVPQSRRPNSSGLYDEIPVAVHVTADYHTLGEFFSSVSAMTRIVNISEISLTAAPARDKAKEGAMPLDVRLTATTFTTSAPKKGTAGKRR